MRYEFVEARASSSKPIEESFGYDEVRFQLDFALEAPDGSSGRFTMDMSLVALERATSGVIQRSFEGAIDESFDDVVAGAFTKLWESLD